MRDFTVSAFAIINEPASDSNAQCTIVKERLSIQTQAKGIFTMPCMANKLYQSRKDIQHRNLLKQTLLLRPRIRLRALKVQLPFAGLGAGQAHLSPEGYSLLTHGTAS